VILEAGKPQNVTVAKLVNTGNVNMTINVTAIQLAFTPENASSSSWSIIGITTFGTVEYTNMSFFNPIPLNVGANMMIIANVTSYNLGNYSVKFDFKSTPLIPEDTAGSSISAPGGTATATFICRSATKLESSATLLLPLILGIAIPAGLSTLGLAMYFRRWHKHKKLLKPFIIPTPKPQTPAQQQTIVQQPVPQQQTKLEEPKPEPESTEQPSEPEHLMLAKEKAKTLQEMLTETVQHQQENS